MQKEKIITKPQNIADTVGIDAYTNPQNKGITLIALIITIIVMLILVGVTINVALNGGLFGKAEKATYQTEASMVKEQLEIAKAIAIAENNGKALSDYSGITIDGTDLDTKIKDKYRNKVKVSSSGDIYYEPTYVTSEKEQNWLKEIGISEYVAPANPWIAKRGLNSGYQFDVWYTKDEDKGLDFKLNSDGGMETDEGRGVITISSDQVDSKIDVNDVEIKIYEDEETYMLLTLDTSTGVVTYSHYDTKDGLYEPGWTMSVK